jgi:hypothetical protein
MNPTKEEFLKQLRIELHKPVKKKFAKRKVRVPHKDHTWSMDLVDMTPWAPHNDGFKWILNVIDVMTRYAWSKPLKSKAARPVLDAFEEIINESGRKPKGIWVDQGREFYNQQMTRYLDVNNIVRYSTHGDHKALMVERLNRTLKTQMWKEFTELQTDNWIDRQGVLLEWYNFKPHSGINNRSPYSMSRWPDPVNLDICIDKKPDSFLNPKFKIRDVVRVSRAKGIFGKGYTANWTQEQFIIAGRRISSCDEPPQYYLMDHNHKRISGGFYEPELQLVKYPFIYLVERVIEHDKQNKRMLIRWVGFSDEHDSWIPEDNFVVRI